MNTGTPVALVNMPFFATNRPSLSLSLLKAGLSNRKIPCAIHYLNIWFAEQIGIKLFRELDLCPRVDMVGDWIFAEAMWGPDTERDALYIQEIIERGESEHRIFRPRQPVPDLVQKILFCRSQVADFIQRCLNGIPWGKYRVAGFSSQFHQQMASLALARRLKERYPELFIVFGGADCRADMGAALFRSFPFIDAVCTGEGDMAFPELVTNLLEGHPLGPLAGMLHRNCQTQAETETPVICEMDQLPYPEFEDFFVQRIQRTSLEPEEFYLVFETSRGCWWGEKSHCAFCGDNGNTMRFRQKSPQRALDEIIWMADKYSNRIRYFVTTDSIIPMDYFHSLLPKLRQLKLNINIFYETRANLKKRQVELFREAGFCVIQPGIESLITPVLKLMHKGITALQNIQLLKWCRQFGIRPNWNFLFGFPGERVEDYQGLPEVIRAISHLPPPLSVGRVRFVRFSPLLTRPSDFGLRNLHPFPSYRYIYPSLDADTIQDLAHYFVGDFDGEECIPSYAEDIKREIDDWLNYSKSSALFSLDEEDRLVICDFRPQAAEPILSLSGPQRRLYEACDQIRSLPYLLRLLASEIGRKVTNEDLDAALAPLLKRKLMLEEDEKYLSLAVPLGFDYFPPEPVWHRLPEVLEALDKQRSNS